MIANTSLFTPFLPVSRFLWKMCDPWQRLPQKHIPQHVPIMTPEEFNMDSLRKATKNFKYPVLVRGLFKDTPAVNNWSKKGYLSKIFEKYHMPIINNAKFGTQQDNRTEEYFGEVFEEVRSNPKSKKYIFFPVLSRFQQMNRSEIDELIHLTNKVVHDDLMLSDKIWNGFATNADRHRGFYNSQFIIGRGTGDMNQTTGTGLHAEPGHNWFTQVVGKKRWYLMEQKYSSFMKPIRGGIVNMQAGHPRLHDPENFNRFPLQYADTLPGDLLYSPDWYWHSVKNYEGFNIGCPIREFNVTLAIQNNALYTSIIAWNKFVKSVFGIDMGGYPSSS